MTIHTPPLLTPEELVSLIDLALAAPSSAAKIPAIHLARLVALRYVSTTPNGPVVTGDGLIRITQSE